MIEVTNTREKKKIKQIVVKKLFGIFDHTIPLNQEERTTIVVGPSGFGKTVILKLLTDLFSQSNKTLGTPGNYIVPLGQVGITCFPTSYLG